MTEFAINFRFNNEVCNATVLREKRDLVIEYDVRPVNPSIVRALGRQIRILKQEGNFNTSHHLEKIHQEFFDILVKKIKEYERDRQKK